MERMYLVMLFITGSVSLYVGSGPDQWSIREEPDRGLVLHLCRKRSFLTAFEPIDVTPLALMRSERSFANHIFNSLLKVNSSDIFP